jgi:hypothetical protein
MTSEPVPASKAELVARIHEARAELEAALTNLSNHQLSGPTDDGGWSIADHLGHIIDWQGQALALLQGKAAHEGVGLDREQFASLHVDAINEIFLDRRRGQSPSEVVAEFRGQQQQILAAIDQISDEELQRPHQTDRMAKPVPLIDPVHRTIVRHARAHLEEIRRLAGADRNN